VKTDDLISLLAHRVDAVDRAALRRSMIRVLVLGTLAAGALTLGILGLRPHFARQMLGADFWIREAFCAALAVTGVLCVRRLALPGRQLGRMPLALAGPVAAMWLLAAIVLFRAAPADRVALILGQTAFVCPPLIAMVSAPVFLAVIWSMRGYAPTRLRLAGAAGGLAAGAVGALVYTLHCPELAPPFLAVWYVLGMLIPAGAGAILGPRLLRW
jgi:hypothetical protein